MTTPLGVGLVGAGMWGRRVGAAALRTPGLRLACCFVRDPETRERTAAELGCRPAPSLDALLDDPEVEAVLVLTPNHVHREIAVAAAEHGRHVLVEKPMADTVEAAEAIRDACGAAGVVLLVAHCFRRLGAARAAAELIRRGELGTVVLAEASFALPGAFVPGSWRASRGTLPGGPMTQLGVHHADTLQAWLGPAVAVRGSTAHLAADAEIDDVAVAILEHASGARSTIACSYVSPKTYRLRAYGTRANLDYRTDMSIWPNAEGMDVATTLTLERPEGARPVTFEPVDMVVDELEELVRCVRRGVRPETGAAEGLAAVRAIVGAVVSAERGRAVRLGQDVRVGPGTGEA